MGNFNRDNRPGGGRNFGNRGFGGNRDRKPLQKYSAVCSSCGKECQLPFKPTGERPVYCRDCFAKNGGGDSNKSYGRDNHGQSLFQKPVENRQSSPSRAEIESINYKLDKIIKLLTTSVDKLPQVIEEEIPTTVPALSEEQPVVVEKKKRASKKVSKTTKE